MPLKEVHVTDISKFIDCRRKYDYSVNQCLKRKAKESGPLWFGTTMHSVWAHLYSNGGTSIVTPDDLKSVWFALLSEDNTDDRNAMTPMAHSMIDQYHEYAKINDNFEVLGIEKELRSPITLFNGEVVELIATLDMIIQDKDTGSVYIVDHKNLASFADVGDLERDFQMSAYLWMGMNQKLDTKGAIYNMIRKDIPAEPLFMNSGELSTKKNIDTTYDKYLQAINQYGLDWEDYSDILERLKLNSFVKRERIFRTSRFLRNFELQLKGKISDMYEPHIYPCEESGVFSHCRKCSYQSLCKAENDGSDIELLKSMDFYVDESGGR